jgi:hypothetical protein
MPTVPFLKSSTVQEDLLLLLLLLVCEVYWWFDLFIEKIFEVNSLEEWMSLDLVCALLIAEPLLRLDLE